MTPATSIPPIRDRRPLRRCASWALSLASLALAAACHSPLPPGESPLAIGYVWPRQSEPLEASRASVSPSEVLIRWQPDKYSAADIQSVAEQQCATFGRTARPAAPPEPSPPQLLQRFECVAKR